MLINIISNKKLTEYFFSYFKVKINNIFSNFFKMSQYLQTTYNISKYEAEQIGESRVYQNPQVLLFI